MSLLSPNEDDDAFDRAYSREYEERMRNRIEQLEKVLTRTLPYLPSPLFEDADKLLKRK